MDPGLFLQHFQHAEIVDDTTVSETIPKGQQSKAQDLVDLIHDRSKTNLFEVNCDKTKKLTISFSRQCPLFPRAGHVLTEILLSQFSAQSYLELCSMLT